MATTKSKCDTMDLTDSEMEKLLNLIQQNPALFDKSNKGYKDQDVQKNIWESIHAAMSKNDATVDVWKTKWRSTRDTYSKKKKEYEKSKRSGCSRDSVKEPKWKWWRSMAFYAPFVGTKITETNVSTDCFLPIEHDVHTDDSQSSDVSDTGLQNENISSEDDQSHATEVVCASTSATTKSKAISPKIKPLYPPKRQKRNTVETVCSYLEESKKAKERSEQSRADMN